MAAEEGLGVQGELNVGGVGDGVTDQNQVWDGWLPLPIGCLLSAALIYPDMTRAVEHLERQQKDHNTKFRELQVPVKCLKEQINVNQILVIKHMFRYSKN